MPMLLFLAAGPSACARAEPEASAGPSPASEQLQRLLDAVNSGDRATLEQYAKSSLSPNYKNSPSIDEALGIHKQTGGFDVLELTDVAAERGESLGAGARLGRDHGDGHRNRGESAASGGIFQSLLGQPAGEVSSEPPDRSCGGRSVARGSCASEPRRTSFRAHVLLARGDTVLLREAYGLADRDKKDPEHGRHTLSYCLDGQDVHRGRGSSPRAGRQIEARRPISQDVADSRGKPVADATIQQLLTHTAGTGDFYGPRLDKNRSKLRAHDDFIKLFGGDALLYKPGTKFEYNNLAYIYLGAAIEHVSGKSYHDYIHEAVFVPAGMTHSDLPPMDVAMEGRASATIGHRARVNGCRRQNFSPTVATARAAPGPPSMTWRGSWVRCARTACSTRNIRS